MGYFCDRYRSRKLPLISGFVAIALATILFMLARNPWILLFARVFQGLSGSVVGVLGLTIIAETASQEQLGAHMAYGSLALTWGMLTGPMAGGLLYVHLRIRISTNADQIDLPNSVTQVPLESPVYCWWLILSCGCW